MTYDAKPRCSGNGRHPHGGSSDVPQRMTAMACSQRGIRLREVVEDDLPFLFRLFADPTRCHLWKQGRKVYDEREFHEAWIGWSSDMMGAKFLIEQWGEPIGLAFEYGRSLEDAHTKVTALLKAGRVGGGRGVVATALLCEWLFASLPFRKISMEVYGYNPRVAEMLRKLGLSEEGRLRENRFWNGQWWDLHIFALYRAAWPDVRDRILRPQAARADTVRHNDNGKEANATVMPD